jgi:hypothetical protein
MKCTINFIDNTVTTDKGSVKSTELYTLLLKSAQSKNITCISVVCNRITSTIIRYCKFAMYVGKEIYFNGKEIKGFDDFKPYTAEISDYFLFKDYDSQANECLKIIFENKNLLLRPYREGRLEQYLKNDIHALGYDVSMCSMSHRDKPQHTKYTAFGTTTEYDYDYVRRSAMYVTSLRDLLLMWLSVSYYWQNDIEDELYNVRIKERLDHLNYLRDCGVPETDVQKVAEELGVSELDCLPGDGTYCNEPEHMEFGVSVVVPFSACEKGVGMYVYSD